MGIPIPSCSTRSFAKKAIESMPKEYIFALNDTIDMVSQLSKKIDALKNSVKRSLQKQNKYLQLLE